jgi:organic radical activating enzyme
MPISIARLITTLRCNRSCQGCCNSYNRIMTAATRIRDVEALVRYPVVCVTGGEPLLEPDRTNQVIAQLKAQNPAVVVYLYTSLFTWRLYALSAAVDGVQFSLHFETDPAQLRRDQQAFNDVQELIAREQLQGLTRSWRLNIDSRIGDAIPVVPRLWSRVRIMPWLSEAKLMEAQPNGLPAGETLYLLEDW